MSSQRRTPHCRICGHDAGDHSMLSAAATYGRLGQLCHNAGCICTHYLPDWAELRG